MNINDTFFGNLSTLWPLCHYFFAYTLYKKNFWESYREVNAVFCEEISRIVEPNDWTGHPFMPKRVS